MIECLICGNDFNTMRALSNHIKTHGITSQQYYDKFFGKGYCKICGKPTNFHNLTLGYYNQCSRGCANKTDSHKDSVKQTKIERYDNPTYNNPTKISEVLSSRTLEQLSMANKKSKNTRLAKYGDSHYNNYKKRIQTIVENKSVQMSKDEKYCYDKLLKIFDKVEYQYFDEIRYPYFCDFYIPEKDLFIELNFTWLHGKHKYNEELDKDVLIVWQEKSRTSDYYKKAIYIWTVNDIDKYNTAEKNKLNYKTFYNQKDFDDWLSTL